MKGGSKTIGNSINSHNRLFINNVKFYEEFNMARYEEITMDKGSDIAVELHLVDEDGSAKDLSGHTAAAKMKKSYNSDSDNTYTFAAIVAEPVTQGIITLTMDNTVTNTIKPGRYVYDVEIMHNDSDGNGMVERVLEGRVHVTPSVT